jgi:hypothetical protein
VLLSLTHSLTHPLFPPQKLFSSGDEKERQEKALADMAAAVKSMEQLVRDAHKETQVACCACACACVCVCVFARVCLFLTIFFLQTQLQSLVRDHSELVARTDALSLRVAGVERGDGLFEIKSELASVKSLLLSRNQFSAVPGIPTVTMGTSSSAAAAAAAAAGAGAAANASGAGGGVGLAAGGVNGLGSVRIAPIPEWQRKKVIPPVPAAPAEGLPAVAAEAAVTVAAAAASAGSDAQPVANVPSEQPPPPQPPQPQASDREEQSETDSFPVPKMDQPSRQENDATDGIANALSASQ